VPFPRPRGSIRDKKIAELEPDGKNNVERAKGGDGRKENRRISNIEPHNDEGSILQRVIVG